MQQRQPQPPVDLEEEQQDFGGPLGVSEVIVAVVQAVQADERIPQESAGSGLGQLAQPLRMKWRKKNRRINLAYSFY